MILETKNEIETKKIAGLIIKKLENFNTKGAKIIALEGELGAGKTTFVRGLAKGLKIREKIKSPTFVLMKEYKIKAGRFYHIDCYRLSHSKDLITLGLKDILKDKGNIVAIEWSEKVKSILPKKRITIHIDHISGNKRRINLK